MNEQSPIKVVDLFSGAGGLSIGFDLPDLLRNLNQRGGLGYGDLRTPGAGFETLLGVEKNEDARETFAQNFPEADVRGDITDIDSFEKWSDAQVVIGGPPCQGFSTMNSKKTENLDDERNQMWQHYMRAVDDIDPDVFLIENVPRFLDTDEGRGAVREAREKGYEVIVTRLWAHEYGVPQKRRRAFVIGSKVGTPFFPEPLHSEDDDALPAPLTVENALMGLKWMDLDGSDDPWHKAANSSDTTIERMENIPKGGSWPDLPDELLLDCWRNTDRGYEDVFGRLEWEKPAVTIRTGFHDPYKGRFIHPEENRGITIREGARLQTFPDEFQFATGAKTKAARQIGNAVPPKLAYELALAIYGHLVWELEGELAPYDDSQASLTEFSEDEDSTPCYRTAIRNTADIPVHTMVQQALAPTEADDEDVTAD